MENEDVNILWDFMIQCDRAITHRNPDIVVVNKTNECEIIDVACPNDINFTGKKNKKLRNYQKPRVEIARLWNKKTSIVSIIISALGSILDDLMK